MIDNYANIWKSAKSLKAHSSQDQSWSLSLALETVVYIASIKYMSF